MPGLNAIAIAIKRQAYLPRTIRVRKMKNTVRNKKNADKIRKE
jgi:hypothetical protein